MIKESLTGGPGLLLRQRYELYPLAEMLNDDHYVHIPSGSSGKFANQVTTPSIKQPLNGQGMQHWMPGREMCPHPVTLLAARHNFLHLVVHACLVKMRYQQTVSPFDAKMTQLVMHFHDQTPLLRGAGTTLFPVGNTLTR